MMDIDTIFYNRYFGRARDLPGVRELFETASKFFFFWDMHIFFLKGEL